MLLEMQNAMNNMMSNNSQLHSMLHGHQSPPLPMEASDSSSSPSSASDSPSCSSPSSPQCPQDSESVVSMDTNSSSASSCGSDSGEDEAVVTVSRQHQDAFAYSEQSSLRPSQASSSPVATPLDAGSNAGIEEQQESWNCWNNNVGVGRYQHSTYSNSQQVSNTAYRQERGTHQQQLSSAPSCEPSDDSQRSLELHTQNASSGFSGSTGCVKSRAHLVRKYPVNSSSLTLLINQSEGEF